MRLVNERQVTLRSHWKHQVLGCGVVTSLRDGVEITYNGGACVIYLTPQFFLAEGHTFEPQEPEN